MSCSDVIDLSSDDEIGEADFKAFKQDPDSVSGTTQQNDYYKGTGNQHQKSLDQSMRQEYQESRSPNAMSAGQSSSCILDQGGSPVDESSLSSASPACSVSLCRQFWKAGNCDFGQGSESAFRNGQNHLRVHPKFLHSNATSHKWAFGAIAELLDNAVDEIQNGATFVVVDKTSNPRDSSPALLIQDDGGGMDPEAIRCCMSFGFSLKNSKSAIGQYGNGFKTSSMRLGADVIVFSRHMKKRKLTQSIGLLSYTFLRQTGHDRIVVPMVDYEFESSSGIFKPLLRYKEEHFTSNLSILLRWSPFATEAELLKQFDDMGSHGTKVVIYNLWFNDEGDTELDLDSDTQDIRISGNPRTAHTTSHSKMLSEQHIANRYHYSLRVYMSILYLRIPQSFRMVLRGKVVEHHNIADDLKFPEFILYRPQIGGNMEAVAVTTIGFLKDAPHVNIRGFNVYHRNRLILPFWCVVKNQSNSRGRGVVGVLEANFIEPTHDKQDFEKTTPFQRLEARLKDMTMEYWDFHCGLIGYHQVKKVPQIQVPSQKTSETGTYSGIQIKNHCSGDTLNRRSASTDRGFQDSLSSPSHSSGGSGQHVNKIHTNSLRGLPFKRKDNAVILEPESMKRHAGVRVDVTDAEQNGEEKRLIGVGNQLLDKEAIIMMNQNKKLHAQLLVHETTVEGLNLKVRNVRKELEEIQSEYAKMLAESESIDATKEERM